QNGNRSNRLLALRVAAVAAAVAPGGVLELRRPALRTPGARDRHGLLGRLVPGQPVIATGCLAASYPAARAESGWPSRRRFVSMMHSATACSGDVHSRSLNHTECVPITLLSERATSSASNPPRSIF